MQNFPLKNFFFWEVKKKKKGDCERGELRLLSDARPSIRGGAKFRTGIVRGNRGVGRVHVREGRRKKEARLEGASSQGREVAPFRSESPEAMHISPPPLRPQKKNSASKSYRIVSYRIVTALDWTARTQNRTLPPPPPLTPRLIQKTQHFDIIT
jgi:hypothetical protein